MKRVNLRVSDEDYKYLVNYKIDHKLKRIEEALEIIIKKSKNI